MVSIIFIGVMILLVIAFFRFKNAQHRFYTILLIFVILFFYITATRIANTNQIDVGTFDGIVTAIKLYFNWLGHIFSNSRSIIGNAIKMDWVGNSTA